MINIRLLIIHDRHRQEQPEDCSLHKQTFLLPFPPAMPRKQEVQKGFLLSAYSCHCKCKCAYTGLSKLSDGIDAQSQDRPAIVDAEYIPFLQFDTCCYLHGQV